MVVVVAVVIEGAVVVVAMAEVVAVGLLVAAVDVGHQIPTGNIDLQYCVVCFVMLFSVTNDGLVLSGL